MKKVLYISLIIILSLVRVNASCNNEELNSWATKVEAKFVDGVEINAHELGYAYYLTITNPREDIKVKVTDVYGASAYAQLYEYTYNKTVKKDGDDTVEVVKDSIWGVGCYNNLEEETYKIEVYGGDNSACKNELLKTLTYTVPRYNRMLKTEMCEKYPDHELCLAHTNKTKDMSEQEFNEIMEKYDDSHTKEETDMPLALKIFIYSLYVIVPFLIISSYYSSKIRKVKKAKGDM